MRIFFAYVLGDETLDTLRIVYSICVRLSASPSPTVGFVYIIYKCAR